ncbi:hypothetical protein MHO82_10785 [Vibrio sp. Of7-15]|uniref:hypothetical protein n=1 Tax=Vibrio sp. Of7-15 TaxID=2724879 RepID=UPI001EF1FFDD|nr:hypothetical protein [Vibrio sp. Of7-15]MCG7497350.1 hypothetical protein [Vibrio sp. Of7-15]
MQKLLDMEEKIVLSVRDFASSLNAGGKVVADMSALVNVTNQLPLANLDYWERLIRSEFSSASACSAQSNWKFFSQPQQLLTWLDLISWDGYKREKTLRTLSGSAPNSFFFSMALRRLNDWVPQVRLAAREQLPLIAQETDPKAVADAISIAVVSWSSWGRIEDADKEAFLQIMNREEVAESLKTKLIVSASGPMPFVFSQLGRTNILDDSLYEIARNAIQPALRAKAYRSLFEKRLVWSEGRKWEWTDIRYCQGRQKAVTSERKITVSIPFLDLLRDSSADPSSVVRKVSAEFLIRELESLGHESKVYADKFATDNATSVSERGHFALKQLENMASNNASS